MGHRFAPEASFAGSANGRPTSTQERKEGATLSHLPLVHRSNAHQSSSHQTQLRWHHTPRRGTNRRCTTRQVSFWCKATRSLRCSSRPTCLPASLPSLLPVLVDAYRLPSSNLVCGCVTNVIMISTQDARPTVYSRVQTPILPHGEPQRAWPHLIVQCNASSPTYSRSHTRIFNCGSFEFARLARYLDLALPWHIILTLPLLAVTFSRQARQLNKSAKIFGVAIVVLAIATNVIPGMITYYKNSDMSCQKGVGIWLSTASFGNNPDPSCEGLSDLTPSFCAMDSLDDTVNNCPIGMRKDNTTNNFATPCCFALAAKCRTSKAFGAIGE